MRTQTPQPVLVCPQCGRGYRAQARFCDDCRLPLVLAQEPVRERGREAERHEWARKIKPQLAEGQLVKVAWARNQSEGEFIQGLLLEEGVPSMLRRSAGFDVPDFLAAGPRDVMVPISGADAANEILLQAELGSEAVPGRPVAPQRLLAGLLAALALGALVIWLISLLIR